MKKYILAIAMLLTASFVFGSGISGVPVLDMYSGAKPASLAGVGAALGGADSIWYNPAGMADIKKPSVGFTYFQDIASMTNMFVNIAVPFGGAGSMEISAAYSGAGLVDNALEESGVEARDMVAALGYAYGFTPQFKMGMSVKYVDSKLGTFGSVSFNGSLGALFNVNDIVTVGADVKNIGSALKYDTETTALPLKADLGAQIFALNSGDHRIFCGVDLGYGITDKIFSAGASAEYVYAGALSLRAGYMYEDKNSAGIGFGAGIKTGMKWGELGIDYAYAPAMMGTNNTESRHILTVTAGF